MSINHTESVSNEPGNIHQIGTFLRVIVAVGGLVATTMSYNKSLQNEHLAPPGVLRALQENRTTFQDLPIIRIGNPEEIHTLKLSGKDGWYVLQEGNTITYWKMQAGIVESNTHTLNR